MGVVILGLVPDREPKYQCLCCPEKTVFYEGEERAYELHVIGCSKRHDAELRGQSLRVQAPLIFDPDVSGDVEFARWVRANRAALINGRMRL